ncbi:MAG TPA: hypothetical protein VEA69_25855 [Tepidisphaeraceae bacterium]|nr:hypothetical protein [Tepidisphaeraceae bacterium]
MANIFQRAAAAIGRFTRLGRRDDLPLTGTASAFPDDLIEPVRIVDDTAPTSTELAATDDLAAMLAQDEVLSTAMTAVLDTATSRAPFGETPIAGDASLTADEVALVPAHASIPLAEVPVAPEAMGETAVASETVLEKVQIVRPAAEMKPAPESKPAKPSITFPQLYDLISGQVNKRADETVSVYERLLATTREELAQTRRTTKLAWSVGGTMTAIAAVGVLWSAGEISGTRSAVLGLKSQVTTNAQAAVERDQLKLEMYKARDEARAEATALKARLDQALLVSAERDRLRAELESANGELRVAKATAAATTQPLSSARPLPVRSTLLSDPAAAKADVTAPKPALPTPPDARDRWSVLLNGQE